MIVKPDVENYLIKSMGLTKTQIKNMLPSEIEQYCKNVTRQEIENRGIYKSETKSKMKTKN